MNEWKAKRLKMKFEDEWMESKTSRKTFEDVYK